MVGRSMVGRSMVGLSMVGMGGQSLAGVSRWQGSVTDPPGSVGAGAWWDTGGALRPRHIVGLSMMRDFPW